MIKTVEVRARGRKGRRGRGLVGLARLRHECHRFREEIVCIRSFPRLQLRWPSLARLEIGNESSEEDDAVWDAAESQTSDTLSICRQPEGTSQANVGDCVESPSQNIAPLPADSKTRGSVTDERWGGTEDDWRRSLEDTETSQKLSDKTETGQGCGEFASDVIGWRPRNDEGAMKSQGSYGQILDLEMPDQILEPLTDVLKTSNPWHDASFMDPESGQDSPNCPTLSNACSNSGARIAATAFFTANPHYNSHELSTECNPYSNLRCQSEGFKLVGFPGSNVSANTSHKEREVWSEHVLCSSFESHICSPSQLSGSATTDKRNQTSTHVENDSLEYRDTDCDESFHALQTHPSPSKHLVSSPPPEAPSCSSDVGRASEEVQARLELNGPVFSRSSVQSEHLVTGQSQNWMMEEVHQKGLAPLMTNCIEDRKKSLLSVADTSGRGMEFSQSMSTQHQNWVVTQCKQKDNVTLTDDTLQGQTLPVSFACVGQTSLLPMSSSLPKDPKADSPTEHAIFSGPAKKQVSSCSSLIALSGMENFARLGVDSTHDSAIGALMAMRIKHALERLGDNRNQEHGRRKSKSKGRRIGSGSHPISETRKDSPLATERTVDKLGFRGSGNPDGLCENSETRRLESHFFIQRDHNKQTFGCGQASTKGREALHLLSPSYQADSATPEEPDLYLQHVIAALDTGHESDGDESSLETPTSTTGAVVDVDCPILHQNGSMTRKFSEGCTTESSFASHGEVCKCYTDKAGDGNHGILNSSSTLRTDRLLEKKNSANDETITSGELKVTPHQAYQESIAKASSKDQPGFSVQINAPPGSFVEVEVGGIVCHQHEEANHQAVANPPIDYQPSTFSHHRRPAVLVAHGKSTSSAQRSSPTAVLTHQQRSLPTAVLTHQQRSPPTAVLTHQQRSPQTAVLTQQQRSPPPAVSTQLQRSPPTAASAHQQRSAGHAPLHVSTLSPPKGSCVEQGRHMQQTLGISKVSPPKFPKTVRFNIQDELLHSFDRKIASLVKKANQLEEETMLPVPSLYKPEVSGVHQRPLEVRRAQKPSILKSSTQPKLLDFNPHCSNHPASQTVQSTAKVQAFGAAAAELVHELKVLMKDRTPALNLECQSQNQQRVVRASAVAQELGCIATTKPRGAQSEKQLRSPKHPQPQQQPTAHSKHARLDDALPSTFQAISEAGKTKPQQKRLSLKPRTLKHPQAPQLSVYSCSKLVNAANASVAPAKSGSKQDSQELSYKSEQSKAVQEKGLTRAKNILDELAGVTFNYDEFRQELRDLQVERKKLEKVVNAMFSTDTGSLHNLTTSFQEQNRTETSIGNLKKTHEFRMVSAAEDPSIGGGNKRQKSAMSPLRELGKNVIQSDSGRPSVSEEGSLTHQQLHVSLNKGDNGLCSRALTKPSHLPTNHEFKREFDHGDQSSAGLANNQGNCTILKPTHKNIEQSRNLQQKQMDNETRLMPLKHTSDLLQSKNRGQHAARAVIEQKILKPLDAPSEASLLSYDTKRSKAFMKSHPPIDRLEKLKDESTSHDTKVMEKSSLTSMPSGDLLNSDECMTIKVADSSTPLWQHGACGHEVDIAFHETESNTSPLATSIENVLCDSGLVGKFAVVEETAVKDSDCAASKLQAQVKPDYFKKYLLQALDSSTLLLQHCVNQSAVRDPALLNRSHSKEFLAQMTENFTGKKTDIGNCNGKLLEGSTATTHSGEVNLKVPDGQNVQNYSQGGLQKNNINMQDPSQDIVPLEENLKGGPSELEKGKLEVGTTPPDHAQEYHLLLASSEKDTSWSGSLKSVLAAYKAAQNTAALMMSSSIEVQKSKERPPFSSRYEHSEKLLDVEKKKIKMERTLKKKENLKPLTLLEKAEKAEAKEMKLRRAHKEYVKSKQKSVQNTGLSGGKAKLQGRLRKGDLKREEWKVPKFIYRTAEFDLKRREDWNDSTDIAEDRHVTGLNTNIKGITQALIAKVLKDELKRKNRQHKIKNLQPVKATDSEIRRKKKDPTELETYAHTLTAMKVKERPTWTKRSPPREDKRELNERQQVGDDVTVDQSKTPVSMKSKSRDCANYFSVSKNELETKNHELDECTIAFKLTREDSVRCTTDSGFNFLNQDVRDSIEHWLNTSGGFEYLDAFNKVGEEDLFALNKLEEEDLRQASTSSKERKTNFFKAAGVPEMGVFHEICQDDLNLPTFELDAGRMPTVQTVSWQRIEEAPQGELVHISRIVDRNALQCSLDEHEEYPHPLGTFDSKSDTSKVNGHPSFEMDSLSKNGRASILNVSNEHAGEHSSLVPGHVDSIGDKMHHKYSKDVSTESGHMHPSHKLFITSSGGGFASDILRQQAEQVSPGKHVNADSPNFDGNQADKYAQVLSRDFKSKLTEDEELELALLEIVLHTILKDDPLPEAEKLTKGMSTAPEKGPPVDFSGTAITRPSTPMSTGQDTSLWIDDKRVHDGTSFGQSEGLVNKLALLESSSEVHASGSAKSSGVEWPEYKCLAEMQSRSDSSEDKHWPQYNGVDEQEAVPDLDQGTQIDDVPSEQISTPSTSGPGTDQKLPIGTLFPQMVAGGTRPPYSAVHSMRAAERQPIDFPGIASLAFGYPSPRPPPLKPVGQTSLDRSSVSVQTVEISVTQSPPTGPPVFVVPFPFYCLAAGQPVLPSYSMYAPHFVAPEGSSQPSAVPIASSGQCGPQFIASQNAPTPSGVIPPFPPPCMFPSSCPASDALSQSSIMPVAPVVQHSPHIPAPAAVERTLTPVENPPFPPSSHHPASAGPSHPSTVSLTTTSGKATSRHVRKLSKLCSDNRDSLSSLDSCCSSPATPSTYLSSPEHEARVASALALSSRSLQGTVVHIFQDGSSDEDETYRGEEVCQSKQDQETQVEDQETLPPLNLMNTNEVQGLPIQSNIVAENSVLQSRFGISPAYPSFPTHRATSSTDTKPDSGMSRSVDSARSSVLIASYDGSGSSEVSVKHLHLRGTAHKTFSGRSNLEEVDQFLQIGPNLADRLAVTRTSSLSSGEILGTIQGSNRNQTNPRSHCFARALPLSEGEVEPGELPSEGECHYPDAHTWGSHQILLWGRPTNGQDDVSEPGEVGKQAVAQLQPQMSGSCGGQGRSSQSLSEGELKAGTLIEPGEVRPEIESQS